MITQWTRVILSDNGVLTDYTLAGQNSDTIPVPLVSAEDSILIGTHFPINQLFFDLSVANSNMADFTVDIWTGTMWKECADLLDETSVAGIALARSGGILFSPERDQPWVLTRDTSDSDAPTELLAGGKKIYNLYWLRLRVSADLSAGAVLNRIGYRFASGEMLLSIDPDINGYLDSWKAGKTDWDEQIMAASDQVIADLKARKVILHPGQILRLDEVAWATAYQTLKLIYPVLGTPLEFRLNDAKEKYTKLMDIGRFTLDINADGVEQQDEVINAPVGRAVR